VDAQSSTAAVCISEDVDHESHPVCLNSDQITDRVNNAGPEVNPDTDLGVNGHCGMADGVDQTDMVDDVLRDDIADSVDTDVHNASSLETTLEYSVCSDMQDGKISDKYGMQTTIESYAESAAESVVDLERNAVVDTRQDAPVSMDIQKPVDLLTVSNSVNVDLRNSPNVCSPPTLMVV